VTRVREVTDEWIRRRNKTHLSKSLSMEFPGCQRLTQREAEVLTEITTAASNKEAGLHLGISPRTVEIHRARIITKLSAKNTADLVLIALTNQQH
jgi:FixJ family two-component response regulator